MKSADAGAGAKCDHFKLGVCTRVRAHLNLDVRGACVRPFFGRAMCDHTFAHFRTLFGTKLPENATF